MAEVVGEREVTCERIGERVVELEHVHKIVSLDDVKVTIGQRAHVRHRLADGQLLPELVTKHVSFACGH